MAEDVKTTVNSAKPALLKAADFAKLLQEIQSASVVKQPSDYYYAIYVRKSTEESENKQLRSLADQITECTELAKDHSLNFDPVLIQETQSAKISGIRPKFTKLLEDLQRGKYDGIIAWHPDRLSRNMKEAGEVIDLLDKGLIKDLQFVSFTFSNDSSGKMLLGITFALSKQYSDLLSTNVSRGNRNSLKEGKALSKAKLGYYKDSGMLLRPDSVNGCQNFNLMVKAWDMRLKGEVYEKIADYLNSQHFSVPTDDIGKNHKDYPITVKKLSEVFRDPFFCGVLKHGPNLVPLEETYEFVSVVTPDDYLKINKFSSISQAFKQKVRGKGERKAELMNGMVFCAYCENPMVAGITSKQIGANTKYYFYFRCDTEGCKIEGKSVRAGVILDHIIDFLTAHKPNTQKAYDQYVAEAKKLASERIAEIERQKKSFQAVRNSVEKKIDQYKSFLSTSGDMEEPVKKSFMESLETKIKERDELDNQIKIVNGEITRQSQAIISFDKFLELFNQLPILLGQTQDQKVLDGLIRKIYLNFTVKDRKVLSQKLNPPFDQLLNGANLPKGGPERS